MENLLQELTRRRLKVHANEHINKRLVTPVLEALNKVARLSDEDVRHRCDDLGSPAARALNMDQPLSFSCSNS